MKRARESEWISQHKPTDLEIGKNLCRKLSLLEDVIEMQMCSSNTRSLNCPRSAKHQFLHSCVPMSARRRKCVRGGGVKVGQGLGTIEETLPLLDRDMVGHYLRNGSGVPITT